jgi:epoxyqueuosine reductase
MKINYNLEMINTIRGFNGRRPSLLLHSCCGPCSTTVIDILKEHFELTVYYYNPNIYPKEEYLRREEEQRIYLERLGIKYILGEYENEKYESVIISLENEPEGGLRCRECFKLRLDKTAMIADELNIEYFTTTLTVSTHKNSKIINEIGMEVANEYKVEYLVSDFKKNDGYRKSVMMSQELGMYRQDYCGCLYSKQEREKKIEENV